MLWPLLIVNLRIMSLISCGTAFFFSDKWSSYPAWRHSMNCKRVAWRWHEIYRSLEDQTCFIFFTFYILIWFLELYISFSWIFDAVSSGKSCPTSMLFLLYSEWRTVELFPPAKSWLVNSNFKRVSCMKRYTRRKRKSYLMRNKNSWYLINIYITNHFTTLAYFSIPIIV